MVAFIAINIRADKPNEFLQRPDTSIDNEAPTRVIHRKVIFAPTPRPIDPKVYYINYSEGENPILPGGITLEQLLENAEVGQFHDLSDDDDSD